MTAFVIPNAIQIQCKGDTKYTFASFLARDTAFDVIYNIWRLSHPSSPLLNSATLSLASKRQGSTGSDAAPVDVPPLGQAPGITPQPSSALGGPAFAGSGGAMVASKKHEPTKCRCDSHFQETVMDCVFPGSPESIYNLMFASGFIKNFLAQDQKLIGMNLSLFT